MIDILNAHAHARTRCDTIKKKRKQEIKATPKIAQNGIADERRSTGSVDLRTNFEDHLNSLECKPVRQPQRERESYR